MVHATSAGARKIDSGVVRAAVLCDRYTLGHQRLAPAYRAHGARVEDSHIIIGRIQIRLAQMLLQQLQVAPVCAKKTSNTSPAIGIAPTDASTSKLPTIFACNQRDAPSSRARAIRKRPIAIDNKSPATGTTPSKASSPTFVRNNGTSTAESISRLSVIRRSRARLFRSAAERCVICRAVVAIAFYDQLKQGVFRSAETVGEPPITAANASPVRT